MSSIIIDPPQVPGYLEKKLIMQDKRKHKRISLHYYLKVSDSNSDEHLGYMIDVSKKGFKMLSEYYVPMGSEVFCTVYLPEELKGWREISFKAKSCWSGKDINPDYYVSGYHISEIEPDGETIIALIIRHYGYNE